MPNGENVTTKFKVDISDLKKNIKAANDDLKLYRAEMKNASAAMKNGADVADTLSKKIEIQEKIINSEKAKLEALKIQLERYNEIVKQGKSTVSSLTDQIEKATKEYGKDSEQVKKLETQLKAATTAQERNETAVKNLTAQIVNQDTAVQNAEAQLKNYANKISSMTNETKEADKALEDTTNGGLSAFGVALGNLAANVAQKAIDKLLELGAAAKNAFLEFDEGRKSVIKATGATGADADALVKNYSNVAKKINGNMATVAGTLGEVNTRFGFTGESLEKATEDFLKFSDITGTDAVTAVQLVSRAMGDAGIDAEKYSELLDELAVAEQASGISVAKLTELLTSYGAPMRALGFETSEAISIFSQWEKAGVNTSIAFSGMKAAIGKWAKEGKDAQTEFKKTLDEIAAMPDLAQATTKSIEVFGQKAGPDLADAIQGGRFEYSQFLKLIENSKGAVDSTFNETQNAVDKYQLKLQNLKVTTGEIVANLLDKYEPKIDELFGLVDKWIEKLEPTVETAITWIETNLPVIEAEIGAIIAAVMAFKAVTIIQAIITALTGLSAAIEAVGAQQAITNAIMAANPIGLIIAAIAALIAIVVIAYNKIDWFREFVDKYFFAGWKNFALWWTNIVTKVLPEAWECFVVWFKSSWADFGSWIWNKIKTRWEKIKNFFGLVPLFFASLWSDITGKFQEAGVIIAEAIGGTFKNAINSVITTVENAINFIPHAINNALELINDLPGVNIPLMPTIELPRLAKGGIVKYPTIAQIGENGKEAVIPLEKNKNGLKMIANLIAKEIPNISGSSARITQGTTINFSQTNNSPMALSRWEIYRQTKNLIAMARGV